MAMLNVFQNEVARHGSLPTDWPARSFTIPIIVFHSSTFYARTGFFNPYTRRATGNGATSTEQRPCLCLSIGDVMCCGVMRCGTVCTVHGLLYKP